MPMPKKVAIVNEGEWGGQSQAKGDYEQFVKNVKRCLEEAKWPDGGKKAEVKVVKSSDEALSWLQRNGVMVFVTRGMTWKAKKLAKENSDIRVVLFTGLIPEGEVIFVEKGPYLGLKQIESVVLG